MLGAMRLGPSLVAIVTCLGLVGCGGSTQSSSTQATGTPAASAQTSTSSAAGATVSSSTGSVSGVFTKTTTTTSASAPPEVPTTKSHAHHGGSGGSKSGSGGHGGASQGAHVQSNVTIKANGDVSPPVVSVPSGVGVALRVSNHGSAAATVTLSVPSHPTVKVAPGASGTVQTGGLKDGTYRILVNGTPRGQLMIGAQGGP